MQFQVSLHRFEPVCLTRTVTACLHEVRVCLLNWIANIATQTKFKLYNCHHVKEAKVIFACNVYTFVTVDCSIFDNVKYFQGATGDIGPPGDPGPPGFLEGPENDRLLKGYKGQPGRRGEEGEDGGRGIPGPDGNDVSTVNFYIFGRLKTWL